MIRAPRGAGPRGRSEECRRAASPKNGARPTQRRRTRSPGATARAAAAAATRAAPRRSRVFVNETRRRGRPAPPRGATSARPRRRPSHQCRRGPSSTGRPAGPALAAGRRPPPGAGSAAPCPDLWNSRGPVRSRRYIERAVRVALRGVLLVGPQRVELGAARGRGEELGHLFIYLPCWASLAEVLFGLLPSRRRRRLDRAAFCQKTFLGLCGGGGRPGAVPTVD